MTTPTDQHAGFDPTTPDFPRPDASAPAGDARGPAAPGGVPHPDNPPWGVLAGVGVALGMFALMLVLQLVFTVPYVFQRVRSGMPLAQAGELLQRDPTYILLAVLSMLPAHLLTLLLAWAVVTGLGKRPFFASLGWSWSPRYGRTELLFLLGAGVVMFVAGQLLGAAFGSEETTLTRILGSSAAARYAVAAFATLTAPLVEEVVFRGVLYSALRRRLGAAASVLAVLAVFAAIHFPQYWESLAALVTITLLSLALTAVRAWTGRLLPCVVLHLVFNGITSAIIIFVPQAAENAPAPPPAPATGALLQLLGSPAALFF